MNRPEFEGKLTEERRLRLGLESLREAYSQEQASAATEEELLSKYRTMHSATRPPSRSWPRWVLAAAAVLFLACGLGLWLASRMMPETAPSSPEAVVEPAKAGNLAAETSETSVDTPEVQSSRPSKLRHVHKTSSPVAGQRVRRTPGSQSPHPGAFIPTMFPLGSDSDYGLQLVRVELPRRTMMSFGLPVDSRELNQPVKADLIIGPDGLTRAIRFVQ